MPIRVLVVEDHPAVRDGLVAMFEFTPDLELAGAFESAEAALEALDRTPCDVALVDVRLPGMSGLDLTRRLAASRPDLPVVVTSATFYRRLALQAGARAFVPKRRHSEGLVEAIRSVAAARPA